MKQQKSLKRTGLIGLCAAVALAAGISAQAQLSLVINTAAKTVSLSGSDSGTFVNQILYLEVGWSWSPGGSGGSPEQVDLSSAGSSTWFSLNPGPIESSFPSFLNVGGGGNTVVVALLASLAAPAGQTISGLGVPISYAGLSANHQQLLENAIGQTMSLQGFSAGSGFAGITVVPEPHEYALMAGLGLIGFAGFRRWRQRA